MTGRPEPQIIHETELDNGQIWQILDSEEIYVILYKGRPVSIRVLRPSLNPDNRSYKRMSYTELGTAIAQVRRYNEKFNCTDFTYVKAFES